MKEKAATHLGVQDLCRKLKQQLDQMAETITVDQTLSNEEKTRRTEMMARLKKQLDDLSL